jgi:XrtN system VIT domain protein
MEELKPVVIDVQYVDNQSTKPTPEPHTPFNPLENPKMLLGFGAILIALSVLGYSNYSSEIHLDIGAFIGLHIIVLILGAIALFSQKAETSTFPTRLNYTFVWLALLQICCFIFNLEMAIFPPSATWLSVVMVASSAALVGLTFRDLLSEKVMAALLFLVGVGFLLDLYFMVILIPMSSVGFIGLFMLGLTVYALAPLLKVIFLLRFLFKNHDFMPKLTRFFGYGVAFSSIMILTFLGFWLSMAQNANIAYSKTNDYLPAWVRVAQILPPSVMTEKMLKSNQTDQFRDNGFLAFKTNNDRFHDPLVSLANLMKPLPELSHLERANILRAIFDAKNQAERRLWRGDNLRLATIETAIELHTPQRLAYTEQVLNIENTQSKQSSWSTEEAILTFRLPEGGVVSTLSLWVNGVEREGLLTTQEKATQAYNSIVGIEQRDPSVVHWQEGNAVSIRVFPCTPTEMRKVKIGFTMPLEVSAGKLFYHLPQVEGLPMGEAKHTVSLRGVDNFDSRTKFQKKDKNYALSANYDPDLSLSTTVLPLSESFFTFQNRTYRIHEMGAAETNYTSFEPSEIYLDINAAWTKSVDKVWELVKNKPVFAFIEGKRVAVTEANRAEIFKQLTQQHFSIFPFHEVENPATALVISINDRPFVPNSLDLVGSPFAKEMAKKLPNMPQVRTFVIGSTTYLNALQQLRVTLSDKGDVDKLAKILSQKVFVKKLESASELAIAPSNLLISEENGGGKIGGDAPDHVFRLFAYNKILTTVGRNFYRKPAEGVPDSLANTTELDLREALALAEKAHIVTPISSLIVLETQADYDRFNIRKLKNALGNATLQNAGAAPEPHEWVLIILAGGIILWTMRRRL